MRHCAAADLHQRLVRLHQRFQSDANGLVQAADQFEIDPARRRLRSLLGPPGPAPVFAPLLPPIDTHQLLDADLITAQVPDAYDNRHQLSSHAQIKTESIQRQVLEKMKINERMQMWLSHDLSPAPVDDVNQVSADPSLPGIVNPQHDDAPIFIAPIPDQIDLKPYLNGVVEFIRGGAPRTSAHLAAMFRCRESCRLIRDLIAICFERYFRDKTPPGMIRNLALSYLRLTSRMNAAVHDQCCSRTERVGRSRFRDDFARIYPMLIAHLIRFYLMNRYAAQIANLKDDRFADLIECDIDMLFSGGQKSQQTLYNLRASVFGERFQHFAELMSKIPPEPSTVEIGLIAVSFRLKEWVIGWTNDIHWGGQGRSGHRLSRSTSSVQFRNQPPAFDSISPMMESCMQNRPEGRPRYLRRSYSSSY